MRDCGFWIADSFKPTGGALLATKQWHEETKTRAIRTLPVGLNKSAIQNRKIRNPKPETRNPKMNSLPKISLGFLWLGMCVALLPGCRSSDPDKEALERFLEAKIQNQHELAQVLATVKDEESMEAARPKLSQIYETEERLSMQGMGLAHPSAQSMEALSGKVRQLEEALQKVAKEAQRIKALPGGEEFLQNIATSSQPPKITGP